MSEAPRTKKEEDRDQYTVVLEDLSSQFKVFGEDLGSVRQDLDSIRKKGDATFEAVGELKEDMADVKEELHIIRNELKEKIGRDEFVALENRVKRLEKAMR